MNALYNRVPKCGSTTLMAHLKFLATKLDFTFYCDITRNETHYFRINSTKGLESDLNRLKTHTIKQNENENLLYVRHTYFMNEHLISTQKYDSFKYINMVRHPVDQFITWYYYERYGRSGVKRWEHVLEPGTESITIDECISGGFSSCIHPSKHSEFMGYSAFKNKKK